MAFAISLMGPPSPRISSSRHTRPSLDDGYDSSSSTESEAPRPNGYSHRRPRLPSSSATGPLGPSFLLPPIGTRSSVSSATSTPVPSRSVSPLPQFYGSAPSSCTSDTESEPNSPLLGNRPRIPWWREDRRRWWALGSSAGRLRSRKNRNNGWVRTVKKHIRRLIRHPFFPSQPISIVLTLLLFTIFATLLTFRLIYFFNPDKEPLPWRAYCSVPPPSSAPPDLVTSLTSSMSSVPATTGVMPPPFPPVNLDLLPPAGLLIGVFSMESAFERRMLVRTTWAGHQRSRDGAGRGDGGNGTSRTIVRFILGQPRKEWESRIRFEMEMYNDIVILPVTENMNEGKSWSFFSWAATDAWVPPMYFNTTKPPPMLSYTNFTSPAPPLAPHDPILARLDRSTSNPQRWVRPDFVVKVDDDSFVMLAELEARLRLELHTQSHPAAVPSQSSSTAHPRETHEDTSGNVTSMFMSSTQVHDPTASALDTRTPLPSPPAITDPLVYWGYLVKNRFMAGELYALSWSLTTWVATDPIVKTMIRGKEDVTTARWMRQHPQASEIRWTNERCWIYDHPRAGTVYSHGFLFPSEATRVRRNIISFPDNTPQDVLGEQPASWTAAGVNAVTPSAWAYSTVSTFGARYKPPVAELSTLESVEALVEGSDMSMLHEGGTMTSDYAWTHREGRLKRYENKRVGGTVVVHFIKKHRWFLETALAMLESDEYSEAEAQLLHEHDTTIAAFSKAFARHRR